MTPNLPFSPIAVVGTATLLIAYIIGAWSIAAGIAGNARKSRRLTTSSVYALHAFTALSAVASALLIYGFLTHDYTIKYVANTSDVSMPIAYKITAFWGGLDGSLLFWVLVLGLFSSIAIAMNAKRHRDMIGYVVATIMVVQVFFLTLLIFNKNPFSTSLTMAPADGQGLNPLLQNYWMVIHPPMLYVGFVAATIPFAFGIGALASGRLDDLWLGSVRVWMLLCFLFLSVGLVLGGRWAYEELGWGGYWAWDPVENAGFIPWFTATAFLHSAIIQEQRGMMKIWNMVLVILTFLLTIWGTCMTRSGIVQSVHAFGEDNALALAFIGFIALVAIVSFGLLAYRADKLSAKLQFESFYSREFAFLANNWILLGCAFFVLFATMFPTISEGIDGSRVTVGIDFFNKWMTPLGIILLFLAGAAPLLAWRTTTRERLLKQFLYPTAVMAVTIVVLLIFFPQVTHRSPIFANMIRLPMSLINFGIVAFTVASIGQEFIRGNAVRMKQSGSDPFTSLIGLVLSKRRKYGGYVVHLGVAVLFVGFGGKAYDRMIDRTLQVPAIAEGLDETKPREDRLRWQDAYMSADGTVRVLPKGSPSTFEFSGYTFLYEDLTETSDDHKTAVTAQISVWSGNERLGVLYPAKWDYRKGSEATSEVAIKVRAHEDVYITLTGYNVETGLANFRIYINPLISWVWIGTLMLLFGTLICLIPQALVDAVAGRGKRGGGGKLGRAADVSIVAILALALMGTLAPSTASAQAEHVPAGQGMGDMSVGYASMNRPANGTESSAMKELLCPCGCKRESIFDCKCASASDLRAWVQTLINEKDKGTGQPKFNLGTESGRTKAYDYALATYVAQYGEGALATPRSSFSWLLPTLAVIGGLGLLAVAGRRWVTRGRTAAAAAGTAPIEDDAYADRLDDELAKTDD